MKKKKDNKHIQLSNTIMSGRYYAPNADKCLIEAVEVVDGARCRGNASWFCKPACRTSQVINCRRR